MKNTIKIGLSNSNDIVVDRSFKNVSDCHATISLTDKGYLFKDHSANGSYINDLFVHNTSVIINHGDDITLSDSYYLNWPSIDMLLGTDNVFAQSDSEVQGYIEPQQSDFVVDDFHTKYKNVVKKSKNLDEPECIGSFNFGAFFLTGIWGLFNGFWWLLVVFIGLNAMNGDYIVEMGSAVVMIIIAFVFGFCGNKWAWKQCKGNCSISDFDKKQQRWSSWGGIIGLISLVIVLALYFY